MNREMFKVIIYHFHPWESKRLVHHLENLGFVAPKVINRDEEESIATQVWSVESKMIVFYDEEIDISGAKKEVFDNRSELRDHVIWVCISSDYTQRFVSRFTHSSSDFLLLRPIEEKDIDSLQKSYPPILEANKAKNDFNQMVRDLIAEKQIDAAIEKCNAVVEDPVLGVHALMHLSGIYWDTDKDDLKISTMKLLLQKNRFNYFMLKEMAVYLAMFPDKVMELEGLLTDLIAFYPCDIKYLIDLFKSVIQNENYDKVLSYVHLTKEFEETEPLRKIKTAALFVTTKYYIAKNDFDLCKELFRKFKAVNTRLTVKDELFYYAEGLGRRDKLIEAFHEEDDKPI